MSSGGEAGAVDAWPTGTLLAEKFRVVRVLGSGGMGVVYEVIHELTRHRRALKTLNAKAREQPSSVERFLREASAAGRIGSPHIVETYDAGTLDTGEPYLVMELLDGETLEARLVRKGLLDPEEIVAIFAQACEGVQAAHEAGIIHRDLKPENVFLTKTREGMRVKLLDFGVSIFDERHRLDRSTQDGTILGTPFYMSPEQVRGESQLDGRSDVYALGIMLHECATGVHPYPAEVIHTIIANVLEKKPPLLTDAVPGFPASLAAVCQRAIEKNVDLRLPSARAFAEGLGACALELGVPSLTPAPATAAAAASWIAALPSRRLDLPSSAAALSVAPSARAPETMTATPGEPAVDAPDAPRRSLVLSALGAVLGAGLVGAILIAVLSRMTGTSSHATPEASVTTPRAAATAPVEVGPSASSAPARAEATPSATVSPTASATTAASASPHASSSTRTSPPPVGAHVAKPKDLAGKGEFKP